MWLRALARVGRGQPQLAAPSGVVAQLKPQAAGDFRRPVPAVSGTALPPATPATHGPLGAVPPGLAGSRPVDKGEVFVGQAGPGLVDKSEGSGRGWAGPGTANRSERFWGYGPRAGRPTLFGKTPFAAFLCNFHSLPFRKSAKSDLRSFMRESRKQRLRRIVFTF